MTFPKDHADCPHCGADMNGGSIWQHFMDQLANEAEADIAAGYYGATRDKGQFGRAIGIYSTERDRTVGWQCPDCKKEWGR